jgi:hypothetical protein
MMTVILDSPREKIIAQPSEHPVLVFPVDWT